MNETITQMLKRINTIFLFSTFVTIHLLSAQDNSQIGVYELPSIDNAVLIAQEMEHRLISSSRTFAHSFDVEISPDNHGEWINANDTKTTWLLEIKSEKACSLNLGFSEYVLAGNAQLSIYNGYNDQLLGNFSALQNDLHKQLFTPLFETDYIRLELTCHPKYIDLIRLKLSTINHAFLNIEKIINSESCHLDVHCGAENGYPEIDTYRKQTNAVGLITINGISLCTGVLVNNTKYDFRPYVLTAEHCGINNQNASSIIVYWQYENSTCRTPDSEENTGAGDGQLDVYNSGAAVRAFYNPSDMTLLELDDPIPSDANAFFAGWNNTWTEPATTFCVHHPSGDEKRISFDENPPNRSFHFSESDIDGNHWRVENWEVGSTEGGSSGAPLFNEQGRVIGQLHGGNAACGNDGSDWFGAISVSWEGGQTPETQLKHWLDPLGFEAETIEGIQLEIVNPLLTFATINEMVNCYGENTAQVELQGIGGALPYTFSIDGVNYFPNPVFSSLSAGEYTFYIADAFNNIVSSEFEITQPDPIDIVPEITLNEVELSVTGGVVPYQYSNNNEDFQVVSFVQFSEQGIQAIYVSDANGCLDSILVDIVWDLLEVSSTLTNPIQCQGDQTGAFELIVENGIPPYGVFYQDEFQSELAFTNQKAGLYEFLIVDSVLDTIYQTIILEEPDSLELNLETDAFSISAMALGGVEPYLFSLDGENYDSSSLFENLANGFYNVHVLDNNNCMTNDTIRIDLVGTSNFEESGIKVFPNPTFDELHLNFPTANTYFIRLISANGQVLMEEKTNSSKKINIFSLEKGLYLLHIQTDTETWIKKVIKM